ncbi:UNVERIFIED_CONTAM: hypothetical protein DES50_1267 [Williamsia faeni]
MHTGGYQGLGRLRQARGSGSRGEGEVFGPLAFGVVAGLMTTRFDRLERRLFADRTEVAFAARKARGVTLGGARRVAGAVAWRIVGMRDRGLGCAVIAQQLGSAGELSPAGRTVWQRPSVRGDCESFELGQVVG